MHAMLLILFELSNIYSDLLLRFSVSLNIIVCNFVGPIDHLEYNLVKIFLQN